MAVKAGVADPSSSSRVNRSPLQEETFMDLGSRTAHQTSMDRMQWTSGLNRHNMILYYSMIFLLRDSSNSQPYTPLVDTF